MPRRHRDDDEDYEDQPRRKSVGDVAKIVGGCVAILLFVGGVVMAVVGLGILVAGGK
jgi:hypothetical protein